MDLINFWDEKSPSKLDNSEPFAFGPLDLISPEGTLKTNQAIVIKDDLIHDINDLTKIKQLYENITPAPSDDYLAIPGLINAHTHAPLAYLRGIGHGKKNMIEDLFFQTECKLTPELLEPLSYSYIIDGLRSGVTCFGDHYYFIEGVAQALERIGVRGMLGECVGDIGTALPGDDRWDKARKGIEDWDFSSRIKPLVAPHAMDTVSEKLLKEMGLYARRNNLPLHFHLSQTNNEKVFVEKHHQCTPTELAHRCNLLSPNTLAVHLINATASDIELLKASETNVGFCPSSQVIYEHIAPLDSFASQNLPLCVATDCAASCDGADLISELKIAGLFARHFKCPDEYLTPKQLFNTVTSNPAKAFGIQKEIGSLEKGKQADIVFVKKDIIMEPIEDILTNLIYSQGSRSVEHVMVAGEWVLWNRELVKASETDLKAGFLAAVKEIKNRIQI